MTMSTIRVVMEKHQEPRDVIIIEGMFGLYSEKLRELMDIKIFVDTPRFMYFTKIIA